MDISKRVILLIVIIVIFVSSALIIHLFSEPDRNGLFPENDIRIVYYNMNPSVYFAIVTNVDPNEIDLQYNPGFINFTQPALIAIVFPYNGSFTLQNNWQAKTFDKDTVFIKQYNCSKENRCSNYEDFLQFKLDKKIDQKQSFNHTVRFRFGDSAPDEPEYSYVLNHMKGTQPNLGFGNLNRAQVTLILDKTADNIHTDPEALPNSFEDKNLQRVWPIKSDITYQTDYQIPGERQQDADNTYILTILAIVLGFIGLFPIIKGKKQVNKIQNLKTWLDKNDEDDTTRK